MNECTSDNLLTLDDALTRILALAPDPFGIEFVPLGAALRRTLASDIVADLDVPPFDTSAMDGYALRSAEVDALPATLPISQYIAAGNVPLALKEKSAARIFTGAPLPHGADCVVIQEACTATAEHVQINTPVSLGDNVRHQGCHIARGQVILERGHKLNAADLGLLASVGCARIAVYPQLRIGILSSGNELVAPDRELQPGQIYNSNHTMLLALLAQMGYCAIDLGCLPDDPTRIEDAIRDAQTRCDIVLSSGGVSVGDKDYIKPVLDKLGKVQVWKLKIKPGKPLLFAQLGDCAFIGLPGNPVSCLVTFCLIARPYLLKCQGDTRYRTIGATVSADFTQSRPLSRMEFKRASLRVTASGERIATLYPNQDSATLLSVCASDGLVVIPADKTIAAGDSVSYYAFSDLMQ